MAELTAAQIEASAPDAWTGKTTSLVYQSSATVLAWLNARPSNSAFAGLANDEARDGVLVEATEAAEAEIRRKFRGRPVTVGQGLLFPAYGAYDSAGILLPYGSTLEQRITKFLAAINRICELMAAGQWMWLAKGNIATIKRERRAGGAETEYKESVDVTSIAVNHPAVWADLRTVIPRLI